MTWKHTLGKPGNTYIISKHWVKKNPNSRKIPKALSKTLCPDYVYNIGFHYLPNNPTNPQELWVCLETGELFTKADVITWLKQSRSNSKENLENNLTE